MKFLVSFHNLMKRHRIVYFYSLIFETLSDRLRMFSPKGEFLLQTNVNANRAVIVVDSVLKFVK
jgi:hypothetical protein